MAAAKPGKADGMGNPRLGGDRRPLYRLTRSDVVTLSFTLSPEFDQILTIQPDGYVSLKDAGPVLAQGLTCLLYTSSSTTKMLGFTLLL